MSWQVKLPALLICFATVPLAILALWMLDLLGETVETRTLATLRAMSQSKAEAIERFTGDREAEVERIAQFLASDFASALAEADEREEPPATELEPMPEAESPSVEVPLSPPAEAPPSVVVPEEPSGDARDDRPGPRFDPLRQMLGLILWDQSRFEELLVIDMQGRVVASTFAGHEGRTAAELPYFQAGLRATAVQAVFRSPITERLTMVIATPISDESHQTIGVLAARLNLTRFFLLVNDATGLGDTGETIVTRMVDDEVVFMAPTRHDAAAAMTHRPVEGGGATRAAALGQSGSGLETDYRGQSVYAAWQYVPTLEWGLVVKMDRAEADAGLDEFRTRLILFASLVLALAALAAQLAAGTLVRPLRTLRQAADRLSKGDFDVELTIHSADEIGALADSFERMVAAIKFFREHSRGEESSEEGVALSEPASTGGDT